MTVTPELMKAIEQRAEEVVRRYWQLPTFDVSIQIDDPEKRCHSIGTLKGRLKARWNVTVQKQALGTTGVNTKDLVKHLTEDIRIEIDDEIMHQRGWIEAIRSTGYGHSDPLPHGTYRVIQRLAPEMHVHPLVSSTDDPNKLLSGRRFTYNVDGPEGPYHFEVTGERDHLLVLEEHTFLAFTTTEGPKKTIKRWVRPASVHEVLDFFVEDELRSSSVAQTGDQ